MGAPTFSTIALSMGSSQFLGSVEVPAQDQSYRDWYAHICIGEYAIDVSTAIAAMQVKIHL